MNTKRVVMSVRALCLAIAVIAMPVVVTAHHSAVEWNLGKRISIVGKVTKVSFRNPHGVMEMEVTGSGKATLWRLETSTKNLLVRRGWKLERIKVGETLTATGHPHKVAPDGLYLREVKLADGTVFGDPEGKDQQLD